MTTEDTKITEALASIAKTREAFRPTVHVPVGTDAHTAPRVYWRDGRPRWVHTCLLGGVDAGLDNTRWTWDSATNTVSPSLHCTACGARGFWTNGSWSAA